VRYEFADCELDVVAYRFWRAGAEREVEPRVFELLCHFLRNPDRLIGRDEIFENLWPDQIVSESALSSRIKAARKLIGDDGKAQALIKTVHGKGFRFVPPVRVVECHRQDTAQSGDAAGHWIDAEIVQDVRYCVAKDGVRIAFATTGNGAPLVKAANWMSHLDYERDSPLWRHWIAALSKDRQLIRYDERGNGLSDRDVDDLSFEAMVSDLESVVDAMAIERFPLLGISQGCAVSVEYAVRHPERVCCLILYGGFAAGWRTREDPMEVGLHEALMTLMINGWGQDNPAFRQVFTSRFAPRASPEQMQWFNELQRITVSPENAARFYEVFGSIDVRHRLAQIRVPTLVLHARQDAEIPLSCGRQFATRIPGARFVTLESENHLLLADEPAFAQFDREVARFLETNCDCD